jgi:porin
LNDVRQNFSFGVGLEEPFGQNADLIGIGFSWGQPANRALRDQYTLEAFYRVLITPHTHLTPDVQVIVDPSEEPDRDVVTVFGLRLRTLY